MFNKSRPITLFYFSGTGNTLLLADAIQSTFESSGFLLTRQLIKPNMTIELEENHDIGIVVPVAVQSTYPIIWDFVKALPDGEGRAVFLADTLEMYSGGIIGPMKAMLEEKHYQCMGAKEFRMGNSMETHPWKAKIEGKSLPKRLKQAEVFVADLIEGRTKWANDSAYAEKMKSIGEGRDIWTKMSQKISVEESECILCGACERNCPMQAITMSHKITIDHDKCISCMRCGNYCPKSAFRLSGKKFVQKKVVSVKRLL